MVNATPTQELIGQARSRQLKVLAGDYYNSRFYHLLSHIGRIDIIRLVSGAISEVNRMKMNFYERFKAMKLTADRVYGSICGHEIRTILGAHGIHSRQYHVEWTEI